MYLNQSYDYITDHISKTKSNIKKLFNDWLTIKNSYLCQVNITPREVNERMKVFNKPFNSYCKTNYIDNNFIVDQILQMSLPYSDGRNADEKKKNHNEFTVINNINPEKLIIYNGSFEEDNPRPVEKAIVNNKIDTWNDIYQIYTNKPKQDSCKVY
jgi:hypothetical protein